MNYKDQGNDEFKKGEFKKAAVLYTKAIEQDPTNAVLYSNRSAAFLKLFKVTKALKDAQECITLKPDWDKGYFRKAAVLEVQEKYTEALEVYQEAQKVSPDNKEVASKVRALGKYIKAANKHSGTSDQTQQKPVLTQ